MTKFIEKTTAITPNRELQSDEYFNETDHLIYCSKCNTPRQCRHELQGKVLIPSIRCKCQQEIFEQEEAQRKLHLIKGILSSLMEQNFFLMFLPEFLRVSRLAPLLMIPSIMP